MNYVDELISQKEIFIKFMKEKYPVFNNSNIFFRDLQYAIKSFFEKKDKKLSYSVTEKTALDFIDHLEKSKELVRISNNSWKLNFSFAAAVKETEHQKNLS
ncbi:MAG: hypothetical protein HYS25_10700 [Ignavibacteriales bacterium]|nr:hypothetical protein [Ignavibacteriales bacterium]